MIEYTRANGCNVVFLEVPGRLEYRDMVLRTVSASCKLVIPKVHARRSRYSEFATHIVSAVGEAYNNIVIHGYSGREPGSIQVRIENCHEWIRVTIMDTGASFDPSQARPPDLEALPESGLGVYIMRSFVDEMTYVPGAADSPNVLTLLKRLDRFLGSSITNSRLREPKAG
jgi:serine/threonine-protein kinase RsbW